MQIKTTISPHTIQEGYHQKNLKTTNVGEGVERRESSYTLGGNVSWYSFYRGQYGGSLKY